MTQDPNPRMSREALATRAFVELADFLVEDFDVIELLTVLTRHSVDLLEAAAAGILLGDNNGRLRVAAASNERIELLELLQIQNDEGPCLDCYRSGRQIAHPILGDDSPWPHFAAESVRNGFPSVCAVPLRRKDAVLGCLNLFMSEPTQLSIDDVALAQALADVASVTIAQYQTHRDADLRATQLQVALNSRVLIEQAKGILAERGQIDMDEAFSWLRDYARTNQLLLTDVASALVAGTLHLDTVADISKPTTTSRRNSQ